MKYRTDFVTNSSSSSSVIINLKSKTKNFHTIDFNIGIMTESLNSADETYQSIMSTLVNSQMIEIICKNHLDALDLAEISGLNDVNLFEDKIEQYNIKNSNSISASLRLLSKLYEIKGLPVKSYDDFIAHPFWKTMNINLAHNIVKIDETFTLTGDDFTERTNTVIDIKNLKIDKEIVDEQEEYEEYIEDDEDGYDEDNSMDDDLEDEPEYDEEEYNDEDSFGEDTDDDDSEIEFTSIVNTTRTSTAKVSKKTTTVYNSTKKRTSVYKFTPNELKLIGYINKFEPFYYDYDTDEYDEFLRNRRKVFKLIDTVEVESPDSIVATAAEALYKSDLVDRSFGTEIKWFQGYKDFIRLYNYGSLDIDEWIMKEIVRMDLLLSLNTACELYFDSLNFDTDAFIDKLNLLYRSKIKFTNQDLIDLVISINEKRVFAFPKRSMVDKLNEKEISFIYWAFGSELTQMDLLFSNIEERTKYKEIPRLYKGVLVSSGCYIATSLYGSYNHPEVMILRRFRDNVLAINTFGKVFIRFYYSISPILVKYFGNTLLFKKFFGFIVKNLVSSLKSRGFDK